MRIFLLTLLSTFILQGCVSSNSKVVSPLYQHKLDTYAVSLKNETTFPQKKAEKLQKKIVKALTKRKLYNPQSNLTLEIALRSHETHSGWATFFTANILAREQLQGIVTIKDSRDDKEQAQYRIRSKAHSPWPWSPSGSLIDEMIDELFLYIDDK